VGYLLASPIRKFWEHPKKMLGPYVRPGMTVVEVGPAMGFFTLPLGRMVGPDGRVVAVDLQERMLRRIDEKARRAGLSDRIETRVCGRGSLGLDDLEGKVDLVVAIHVVHEVPDKKGLFEQFARVLGPEGRVVLVEPKGHVEEEEFEKTIGIALGCGFNTRSGLRNGSHSVVLER
jgi:ubiquinone/menaquinone biosynthesis C-methylase UbiE